MSISETDPGVSSSDTEGRKELNMHLFNEEYETQYFGFTPKSFSDGVYNSFVDYLYEDVIVLEEYMSQEFNNLMNREQIREAAHKVIPVFTKAFDKAFNKLERYLLENILHIPDNVLLEEDKAQSKQYTERENEVIDEDIKQLKQKILNAKYMNAALKRGIKDIEQVQAHIDAMSAHLDTLNKVCKDAGVPDTAETMKFLTEKVSKMQEMIKKYNRYSKYGVNSTKFNYRYTNYER
ncbi:unnamed protein product [Owenia fusiformis]|uniref:Protein MIS12 homolog n=1 Tax=Owenia fusiformis TaxID=6347 RepID=A0A8J1UBX8_OWEFU|nr:unnamed protein product [Owenia fusiformis]